MFDADSYPGCNRNNGFFYSLFPLAKVSSPSIVSGCPGRTAPHPDYNKEIRPASYGISVPKQVLSNQYRKATSADNISQPVDKHGHGIVPLLPVFLGRELSGRVKVVHIFTVFPLEPMKTQRVCGCSQAFCFTKVISDLLDKGPMVSSTIPL